MLTAVASTLCGEAIMNRSSVTAAILASAMLTSSTAFSQATRSEEIEQQKDEKADHLQPQARELGDLLVTKLEQIFAPDPPSIRPTFGDFRPGAGFAVGVESNLPIGERGTWRTSTAWSVENFKQIESVVDVPLFATDRVHVRPFVTWNDAPELSFFGIGADSTLSGELGYGLRTTEVGADLDVRHPRWFEYGAGAGYLSAITNDGTGSESPVSRVAANEVTGIGSSPAWWHTTAFAAIDTRHSPGYTDSGGLYSVRLHDYIDRERTFDFTRTEIDLRQFVPILHDNWIVALQARADLTGTATGQAIPFFMLPAIGGRDTLPGFTDYRFTDRDSLLMRSELRWTPSPLINMAVFLDQGTVAPSAGALSFNDLKRGWGLGARFHGDTYTALRLEVAHSAEGWRYNIARGVSF
jgi:hypothetical protein